MVGWQRIRDTLRKELQEETDPRCIAAGFAAGVFLSFAAPPFFHTALAVIVAIMFRLSKVASIAGAWVNTPYTIPVVYYAGFRIGRWILGVHVRPPKFEGWTFEKVLSAYRSAKPFVAPTLLGTTLLGILAAGVSYVVVYRIAVRVKSARHKQSRKEEGSP